MKALATLLVLAAASASAFAGRVPFLPETAPTNDTPVAVRVLDNNMPLVRGEVDGRPCTLLFDTGATHTTLDRGFVTREFPDRKLEKVMLAGETNVEGSPSLLHVASLKVGAAGFGDFDMMVLDMAHLSDGIGEKVDGVVGMNVIGRVMTLVSLGSGEVVFSPRRDRLSGFTNAVARAASDPFSVALKAGFGDKMVPVIVDSGASMTFLGRDVGWPETDEKAELATTDVNGCGNGLRPVVGKEGPLMLGIPVTVRPMVVPEPMNRIGSDTLRRYDMLVGWRRVAFRPHREPSAFANATADKRTTSHEPRITNHDGITNKGKRNENQVP